MKLWKFWVINLKEQSMIETWNYKKEMEAALIFQNLVLLRISLMKMKIFGATSLDSLKVNLKANIIRMGQKKEGRLDKVHILKEIELNFALYSLLYKFILYL
jgi:hypothetical protein